MKIIGGRMEYKLVCPKCFSETGASIALEEKAGYFLCPKCQTIFSHENGELKALE